MFQHRGIDAHLIMRIGALQVNSAAVALLQQMRRARHHPLQTSYFGWWPHIDVKISRLPDGILADDQTEARYHPVFFGLLRSFVSHEHDRMIVIVLADTFELMHHRDIVFLEL